jgi:hypothetical protein
MDLTINKSKSVLTVERTYYPHPNAMLAALRLVLGLPQVPVNLGETK